MNFKVQLDDLEKLFLQNLWLTALGWTRMALESSSVRSAFCLVVTKAVCSNRLTGRHLDGGKPLLQESTELTQGQRSPPPISKCQCVLRSALIPGLTILSVRYALLHNDPNVLCFLSFIKQLTVLNRETLSCQKA